MKFPHGGLYPLTPANPDSWDTWQVTITEVVRSGIKALQLRVEDVTPRLAFTKIRKECFNYKIPFIVNNDLGLANSLRADGIHLGKDDCDIQYAREVLGPDSIIGVSCYDSLNRALAAIEQGASYVAFGRFFSSQTKPQAHACPLNVLREAVKLLDVPVVAIGGISPDNVNMVLAQGAKLLAVGHSVFGHNKPVIAVEQFGKALDIESKKTSCPEP